MIKSRIMRLKQIAAETTLNGRPLLDDPVFRARLTRLEVETTALEMSVLRVLANESKRPGQARPGVVRAQAARLGTAAGGHRTARGRRSARPRSPTENPPTWPTGFAALPDGAVDAMPTYFNWRKASIYAGSNEVQRTIIAKAILKF